MANVNVRLARTCVAWTRSMNCDMTSETASRMEVNRFNQISIDSKKRQFLELKTIFTCHSQSLYIDVIRLLCKLQTNFLSVF